MRAGALLTCPRMPTLFLVRHAQVDGDLGGRARLLGWTDVGLSARGDEESRMLRYVDWRPEPVIVYTSPLQRALRTAESIAMDRGWPVESLPGLREIHCGTLDGQLIADTQRQCPELWSRHLRQDDTDFRWPHGESYRDFRSRVTTTLASITSRHEHDAVLLVTHAGVISEFLGTLAGINPARWDFCRPGYASVTTVWWDSSRGRHQVLSFDDRSHLGGPPGRPLVFATPHQHVG